MGSSFILKNGQSQEFNITHQDNAGAITINSNDIARVNNTVLTGTSTIPNINSKNISHVYSTPITITSWSYSGTTITLNVASHSFTVGDYIEISGLTATTYPANGIHLITGVTSTTIVFTLSATPTGTAGVSSATVKGYVTINGRVSESVGVNQTWSPFTAVSGVTYYNTSGKPKMIMGTVTASGAGTIQIVITVQGVAVCNRSINVTAAGYNISAEALVPAGTDVNPVPYSFTVNGTFSNAYELK